MNSYLICDLETGITEYCKRKAHYRKNEIVGIGLKNNLGDKKIQYVEENSTIEFKIDEEVLVGHNLGKFDVLYLWKYGWFQEFLREGGEVFDTMLAEYFLSGQRHKFPGLREIAVEKYGCQPSEKLMEEFWDVGIDTRDIPVELVLHDLDQDVEDTERVFLRQLDQMSDRQLALLMIQNDLQLATSEMEVNGVYVNQEILEKNMSELQARLDVAVKRLNELVEPYWKLETE